MKTNYQFRKKPIVIEAFQMTRARREDNAEWPMWLHHAWQKEPTEPGAVFPAQYPNSDGKDMLMVRTLEGALVIGWDDWIICGVNGELYPCKPDVFAKTYEPA